MLDKHFDPKKAEEKFYQRSEKVGFFKPEFCKEDKAEIFSIMMPPPNVTGSLHIGHALNHSLQDIIVRFQRMLGKKVLWQPGTDHAGIATQMVVERNLAKEGKARRAMGREAFLAEVWRWKEESGGTIVRQLKRLGVSPDWERERFTLDKGLNEAVRKSFVTLYKDGLIYRDKRLVNWDVKFQTAISDLEVVQKEVKGSLWHLKYPLKDDPDRHIIIATTRPETMFGDRAVAVHPEDARYKDLIGKKVILPIIEQEIPIIADSHVDPEFGSGALKITPAHDFNDFQIGKRHQLEMVNILTPDGHLNENVPKIYQGLKPMEARKKLVEELEEKGILLRVEPHIHMVPHGDRSDSVIEPYLTDQWYCDAPKLAKAAREAVEKEEVKFIPKNWENTYFDWMGKIEPWCISRQLWWGHQIPAWYGKDGKIFVAETKAEALEEARQHYGLDDASRIELRQDEDVLDTWFSSALWPFSTLGWPNKTEDLKQFYPTSLLITGFDIIFFWVARMMMMGIYFMGEPPFKEIYIHALVRDAKGQKMSKSKGNVIDPLIIVDQYGADALRMTLAAMAAQGRDIKLSTERIEGYRNFVTKLWNASKFAEMKGCKLQADFDPIAAKHVINCWIRDEITKLSKAMKKAFETYRFNEAALGLYHFAWNIFCDWYIEFSKPLFDSGDQALIKETQAMMAWALKQLLIMLNPIMPFVTEEIAEALHLSDKMLATNYWPELGAKFEARQAAEQINALIELISSIRSLRSELSIPQGALLDLKIIRLDPKLEALLKEPFFAKLARLASVKFEEGGSLEKGSVELIASGGIYHLPIGDVLDIEAEKARLDKARIKLEKELVAIEKRLSNEAFIAKAPESVVEEQKLRRSNFEEELAQIKASYERILSLAG